MNPNDVKVTETVDQGLVVFEEDGRQYFAVSYGVEQVPDLHALSFCAWPLEDQ